MSNWNGSGWNGNEGGATSARSIIYGALRLIGVLRAGQQTSPEAMEDGLASLNEMVDSWNAERLMVNCVARNLYDLTAGKQTYGMGPGGDWDTLRPGRIEQAGVLTADSVEIPLRILNTAEWAATALKGTASNLPSCLYNDEASPIANVNIWPIPNVSSIQVALYAWQQFEAFTDMDTPYTFPQGVALALRYNLAVQIAPMFILNMKTPGVTQLLGSVEAKAVQYKSVVQIRNTPEMILGIDPELTCGGGFDIRTGDYR